ncbi:class I SAM-dependent methyltransferase [Glutamicibacter sp. MNS18]|uniref:class I SAM-dependent methyltransferase n=1 Tax=Glutamicibacter sp. MNS18 TaxID=2989817 RepID=UPI0022369E48|nr:class I SAM-dependent methyltransferase [Glutamicibacter sp. MNS18]MCW4465240.1 class I SAM-dependent methyltransferase [Glutamicibacter sp. MNS18]
MPRDTNYDTLAAAYSRENEASYLNAYYERLAMLEPAGEVAGRRILDIGCGSGPLKKGLLGRGAAVTGFDASRDMLSLARDRLGLDADLHLADLAQPLPFR